MTQNTRLKTQDSRLKRERKARRLGKSESRPSGLPAFPLSLLSCVLCLASCSLLFALPSLAQTYQQEEDTQSGVLPPAPTPEVYHESALRRFEVVFTISLPFTAFHSYLAVRGAGMLRQRKVSPELHRADWNAVGGLTILFSSFVAFWDYLHTRGEDVSEKPSVKPEVAPRGRDSGYSMLDAGYWTPSVEHRVSSIQYPVTFLSIRF